MKTVLLLATLLIAPLALAQGAPQTPPPVKDRACFAACAQKAQQCVDKCGLPESKDEDEYDEDKPENKGKAPPPMRKPTKEEECAIGCMKKNEGCFKGCK